MGDWNLARVPSLPKAPDFPIPPKCVALDHFEQMNLDVIADCAVGFYDLAGFAVNAIPRTTNLRAQPPTQRSEVFTEAFPVGVGGPHGLASRTVFKRDVGAAIVTFAPPAPARAFDDYFVHVSAHRILFLQVDGPRALRAAALDLFCPAVPGCGQTNRFD